MNPQALLAHLRELGVDLQAHEGRLRVSAPRGQLTAELRTAIADHRDALLMLLAGAPAAAGVGGAGAPGDDDPSAAPGSLSFFQHRAWVRQCMEPSDTAMNMACAWLVDEAISHERLRRAIGIALERHHILRTRYPEVRGEPGVERVEAGDVQVMEIDLSCQTAAEHAASIESILDEWKTTPFDLTRETPVRLGIARAAHGRLVVLCCAHHIAVDAWSIGLLQRELDAAAGPRADSLPPALQFANVAAAERRQTHTSSFADDLQWWKRTLSGIPALSVFPPDITHDSPAGGATVDFHWPRVLAEALTNLARRHGSTLFIVLLAACAVAIRRHASNTEVVLGIPMGDREQVAHETIIGPFVNLMVVRIDLSGDPSFATVIGRTRQAFFDAHAHRQVPFEALVEWLRPPRALDHTPIFQIAVVQHNAPAHAAPSLHGGGALHELTWFVRDDAAGLRGSFEFRTDLFSEAAIDQVSRHLRAILEAAVAAPQRSIDRMPLVEGADRDRLLEAFSRGPRAPEPPAFVEQFMCQARSSPEAIAVSCGRTMLTYRELDRESNRLAHRLLGLGAGRGTRVGISMIRSPLLLVALLAVQKCGAAYVPLDPSFPAERLAFMVEDSGTTLLLFAGTELNLAPSASLRIIDLEQEAPSIRSLPDTPPPVPIDVADPVYLMYTSGSTGRPKGVVVSHRNLANFLGSMRRRPGLSSDDVLVAVTTISFDIAGLELYLPLATGARVELISAADATDPLELASILRRSGATVLQATPSIWRLLLESGWQGMRGLRALCGGETLPRDLAAQLHERVGELWNMYGPTETTIWSTVARVDPRSAISIGRAIDNTDIYVLDPALQPVPAGLPGEIWIGGRGVAIGYHERPELNAERFVADPFSGESGARMYRTGDLGRWDAQGNLYHLGRVDQQVKLRGLRIELGEIEASLATHPDVSRCVVTVDGPDADARLVAYIVSSAGAPAPVVLRAHLRQTLPDYMVPQHFVHLDALPTLPNGKLDRAALPQPDDDGLSAEHPHDPPRPGTEEALASIWREVLQVARVGADDNFFDLGGHSLLVLRAVSEFARRHGLSNDARDYLTASLRQLAATAIRLPPPATQRDVPSAGRWQRLIGGLRGRPVQ